MIGEQVVKIVISAVDQASAAIKGATQSLEAMGEKAKRIGADLESAGMRMTALGAGMGASVKAVVGAFAEQENAAAGLKATMLTAEGLSQNFEKVQALAVELGNQLPGNTADFSKMASTLLQLGVSEEAVLGGVGKAAANLAVVMKLPYEEAAEVAAKLKEATGVAEGDMLKFMDTIQRVGHQGVKSSEMMYAFARSGGALKQFGLQGEESARKVATLYAQLIKAGASGETVGTGFASILNRLLDFDQGLTKPAAEAKQKLKDLGVEVDFFDDKTGQFKGVDNMIAEFDKLKGLNQVQMGEVFKGMFGGGQDQQFAALLAQGGIAANKAMEASIAKQGNLDARVAEQLDTLASKWEAATGTFENLLATIGAKMAPRLKEIVDWFGEISAKAQAFVNENPVLAEWLGLAAAGTAAVLVGGGVAALAIGGTISAIGSLMTALSGLSAFLAANPFVLALLGLTAAATAGWAFGTWLNDQINAAVQAVTGDKFATLGSKIYDLVQWFKGIPGKITAAFKAFATDFLKVGEMIVQGIIDGVKAKAAALWDEVKALGRGAIKSIKESLGIKSPSREFYMVGEMAGDGLRFGILAKEKDVQAAAKKLGQAAIYGVKDKTVAAWLRETLNDEASLQQEINRDRADLFERGRALARSLRSELDVALDDFAEYERLLDAGAISWDVYAQAVADATLKISAATKAEAAALTGRDRLAKRNDEIAKKWAEGVSISSLSREYGLSEEWIKKLVTFKDEADSIFGQIRRVGENAIKGLEDALVDFVKTGKLDFRSLVDSIVADLARIAVRQAITAPLSNALSSFMGSLFKFAAKGDVFSGPGISAYSGQVVDRPTFFAFASGGAVMGEAGAEAVLPLTRLPNGDLGVQAGTKGGVEVPITINVQNSASGSQARVETREENGERFIDVIIEQVESTIGRRVSRGEGLAPFIERRYGLSSAAGAYR